MKTLDGTHVRVKADFHTWWAERLTQRISAHEISFTHEQLHSLLVIGDTFYSYGRHFPMAEVFRTNGDVTFVLLNGDIWRGPTGFGSGTSGDQAVVRKSVEAAGVPFLVVPFSALDAAGVDHASLRVIESLPERITIHEHESDVAPGRLLDDNGGAYLQAHVEATEPHHYVPGFARLESDGRWRWESKRHWLGEALIRGRVTENRTRKAADAEREQWEAAHAWRLREDELREDYRRSLRLLDGARGAVERGVPEVYDARTQETWEATPALIERWAGNVAHLEALLADHDHDRVSYPELHMSVDGRTVHYRVKRWAYYLSAFDYAEARPSYFLCELPRSVTRDGQRYTVKPETVAEALDWLRPDEVVQAERAGVEVLRQGDVFAIPTSMSNKDIAALADEAGLRRATRGFHVDNRRPVVLGTNHAPTHAIRTTDGGWYGRGRLYHDPVGRTADHAVVDLGDRETWYRLVKNTVPEDKGTTQSPFGGRRPVNLNRSGDSRAWTLGGDVD